MIEGELRDRIDELESEVFHLEDEVSSLEREVYILERLPKPAHEIEEKLIKIFLNDK